MKFFADAETKKDLQIRKNEDNPISASLAYPKFSMAGVGSSIFLNDSSQIIGTARLASCYALIVVGERGDGQIIIGLNHWVGDDNPAEYVIQFLKRVMQTMGALESSFSCYALGGQKDCPENKKEIELLEERKIIQYALHDVNQEGADMTDLTIKINNNNEVLLEYFTKNYAPVLGSRFK